MFSALPAIFRLDYNGTRGTNQGSLIEGEGSAQLTSLYLLV